MSAWNWRGLVIICRRTISNTASGYATAEWRRGCTGDPEELRTAVSNLLDNAVKYSPDGVHISVELDAPDEKRVVLRVRDQGVGIPEQELKRIFKRFYRVTQRSLSQVKGTGLGLFIVRSIARKHGGRVFAESEGAGKGTTVTLRIAPESDGGVSRVLVVEDEAHLADGLRFNLQAEGHAVEVAADGETALERLVEKRERFDAVVLDVMLPGKSGFDVAALLREKKNYVPILMLTARGRAEDVLQGFAAGADDYLPKPFELAILIARLESLLRRSVWMKDRDWAGDGEAMTVAMTSARRGTRREGERGTGGDYIQFWRQDDRLRRTGIAHDGKYDPSDGDGGGVAALSGEKRRPRGFAQVDFGRCVGIARRHRYARHR